MDKKQETIEMLRVLKANSHAATLDGKAAVVIEDCQLNSLLWALNQAISQIKEGL